MPALPARPDDTDEALITQAPNVLSRTIASGVVVLGPGRPIPTTLQGTGAAVWVKLATPRTEASLVEELAEDYDADPAVVASDLRLAIVRLLELGLLERSA